MRILAEEDGYEFVNVPYSASGSPRKNKTGNKKVCNNSMVKQDKVWYGMVWYGMVWYAMVWYISNPTMRTGLDFKSAQFDQARGEAEIQSELEDLK